MQTIIRRKIKMEFKSKMKRQWPLFVLLAPSIIFVVLFCYIPIYGIIIGFTDYNPTMGSLFNSNWIGFDNFSRFFSLYNCKDLIFNTLSLSVWGFIIMTPSSIILALMINEVRNKHFKQCVQTISYAPFFVSTVVLCGMVFNFCNVDNGLINKIITMLGGKKTAFMESAGAFNWIYQLSGLWQGIGWSSIIYVGTLSNVNPSVIEAAQIDGANRLKRIWYIKIPTLAPMISIMSIMSIGSLLSVGFEKAYLLQTSLNLESSEIIATFVYKKSLLAYVPEYGYGTAIGLLNSGANLILLITANFISKKVGGESLW
jgi:putative aldouronate transport system permease protein